MHLLAVGCKTLFPRKQLLFVCGVDEVCSRYRGNIKNNFFKSLDVVKGDLLVLRRSSPSTPVFIVAKFRSRQLVDTAPNFYTLFVYTPSLITRKNFAFFAFTCFLKIANHRQHTLASTTMLPTSYILMQANKPKYVSSLRPVSRK